jgi:hypothetical protein
VTRACSAPGPGNGSDRQLVRGDRLVEVLLPAVLVDQLVDVALVVEEPHADHRHAQVAHALQVVAREDAEPPGVDGQRLVEAELGGEVGHRPGQQGAAVARPPAVATLEVLLEAAVGLVDAGLKLLVLHPARDLLAVDALEEGDRVVVDGAPDDRIDLAEDRPDVRLPRPPEVPRQLAQLRDDAVGKFTHRVLLIETLGSPDLHTLSSTPLSGGPATEPGTAAGSGRADYSAKAGEGGRERCRG